MVEIVENLCEFYLNCVNSVEVKNRGKMFSSDIFPTAKSVSAFFEPKKMTIDNSTSYPHSNPLLAESSTVMTPTSPHTFYLPIKPFEDTENQSSDNKTMVTQQLDYNNECFNWYDIGSMAETPCSKPSTVPSANTTVTSKIEKDEIFNFEPEYIEFFQRYCENGKDSATKCIEADLSDTDYMNYNESNCQAKSICASPNVESWINCNNSISPKPINALPPISSISQQFQTDYQNDFGASSVANDIDFTSFNNFNFNFNQIAEDKIGREDKNIWEILDFESSQPESPTDNIFIDEIFDCKNELVKSPELPKINNGNDNRKDANPSEWICQWENCFKVYPNQSELVKHIEKTHIEVKKGDVFSCYWLDCTRQHKPFNARYKLLIHMRVHSGEKPNKCQVSAYFQKYFIHT